jgi:hypothetical protein
MGVGQPALALGEAVTVEDPFGVSAGVEGLDAAHPEAKKAVSQIATKVARMPLGR